MIIMIMIMIMIIIIIIIITITIIIITITASRHPATLWSLFLRRRSASKGVISIFC